MQDFISHLEELRKRILSSIFAFLGASFLCYFFSHAIIDYLIIPLTRHENAQLIFQTPYEAFLTHLKVSAFGGLILASVVIFSQFWLFVAPGLYRHERKFVFPLILISVALFASGVAFAYFLVIPWGLGFLLSFQTDSLRPLLAIGPYFSFLMGLALIFGLVFDLPVVLIGLVRLGVIDSVGMAKSRKYVILGIFILSALLTPADPITQILLALPLLVFFEITLIIARWIEPKTPSEQASGPL